MHGRCLARQCYSHEYLGVLGVLADYQLVIGHLAYRRTSTCGAVVGPAELLQGLGPQAQGHPEAGRRGRRQPLGCQGVPPSQVGGAPTLWAGLTPLEK